MKAGTMEGLIGAGVNMKLMDTPMRVYKEARRKGDLGAMERAMGYASEFQDTAYEYKEKAEKELRKEMQENREEQQRERDEKKRKYQDAIEKAEKHEPNELCKFKCGYSDWINHNDGYFFDWQEFFGAWHDFVCECEADGITVPERPVYVWGTEEIEMNLDAGSIIESACEELYDDAMSNIDSSAIKEMQDYLNLWKYRYCLTAYGEDHRHAIRIPWEEDKEYGE